MPPAIRGWPWGRVIVAGLGLFSLAAPGVAGADKETRWRPRPGRRRGGQRRQRRRSSPATSAGWWPRPTGGKPAAAAAMPFLQAQALEETDLLAAWCWPMPGDRARRPRRPRLDAALADLKAKLRRSTANGGFPQRPVDHGRRFAPPARLERGLAAVPGPLRHAGARGQYFGIHRRELDGSRVSVSQILLRPAASGREVLARRAGEAGRGHPPGILAGEISFADAAEKYSAGPSAKQGGRLGDFARHGAMDEAFSRAAFALKIGEVSPPVTHAAAACT